MITTATTTATTELYSELAQLTLAAGVPIEIDHLRASGGPNDYQIEAAQKFIEQQALGEAILYCEKGQTADQMRILCEICAILAYCPGGVTVMGLHFEARESEVSA